MKKATWLKSALFVFLSSSLLSLPITAQEDIGSELPADVRVLLIQEMVAILGATQSITDAMIRGDDEIVATQAQHIHDSFILAQELTDEQHTALVNAASEEFLEKDGAFHAMGAALAEAARAGDKPLQQKIFFQMQAACVACHTDHAAQRFPGFQASR